MLMLITTLISATASAGGLGLTLDSGLCGPLHLPCRGFLDTDMSIIPDPDFREWTESLGATPRAFRVDVTSLSGDIEIDVNGYTLDASNLSRRESVEGHQVYYVPASAGARIVISNVGRDPGSYFLELTPVLSY
jgi:hypothetical protein